MKSILSTGAKWSDLSAEEHVLAVSTAAETFLATIQSRAAEAFRIREGSTVEVDRGRRIPYGFYTVTTCSTFDPDRRLTISPIDGGRSFHRVAVKDVKILPDYRAAFADAPLLAPYWSDFAAGMCARGFGSTEILIAADRVDEAGRIGFLGFDEAGIPADWFARQLRAMADNAHWTARYLGPNQEVHNYNLYGSVPELAPMEPTADVGTVD